MGTETTDTKDGLETVAGYAERSAREDQEKAAEEERRAKERTIELRIYKVRGRLELALEGLARTQDKAEEAAWARIIKANYKEMDQLTQDHKRAGGSSWSSNLRPFDANYEK